MPYILKTTESFTVCRYSTHFCFPLHFTSSISWPPTTLRLWQEGAGAERGVTVSEHGVTVPDTTLLVLACVLVEEQGEMG